MRKIACWRFFIFRANLCYFSHQLVVVFFPFRNVSFKWVRIPMTHCNLTKKISSNFARELLEIFLVKLFLLIQCLISFFQKCKFQVGSYSYDDTKMIFLESPRVKGYVETSRSIVLDYGLFHCISR